MEIPWLNEWLDDPDHQIELLMGAVFVLMWILAKFLGITSDDFQGYWGKHDDSGFDDE
jgi:hypothetical protein